MFNNLLSLYSYKYPEALVALMHKSGYKVDGYLKHLHKTKNFNLALKPATPKTKKTVLATNLLSFAMLVQIAAGIVFIILGIKHHISGGLYFGIAIILLYPIVWAYIAALGLILKDWFVYGSSSRQEA